MELFIKNMVCDRCISTVKRICEKLNLNFKSIELGKIVFEDFLPTNQLRLIGLELEKEGMPILTTKNEQILNRLKILLRKNARADVLETMNLSKTVETELGVSYRKISSLFSDIEGKSINQYYNEQKIEKAKELILYNFHSISEISYLMNYSSPQHLSRQFKKITGMSPTEFKKMGMRVKIDKI